MMIALIISLIVYFFVAACVALGMWLGCDHIKNNNEGQIIALSALAWPLVLVKMLGTSERWRLAAREVFGARPEKVAKPKRQLRPGMWREDD